MSWSARVWPWVPVALLGVMLTGLSTMASIAINDPGFALERNYYQKAVAYDEVIAQRTENARLGWSLDLQVDKAERHAASALAVRVRGASGAVSNAEVRLEALRNAGAQEVLEARLVEAAPGEYRTSLPLHHGGLWEFRFTIARGTERFTDVVRVDVAEQWR